MQTDKRTLLQRQKELLKEYKDLMKEYKQLINEFSQMAFPLDITDNEPADDRFRAVIDLLIRKSWLTKDVQPTPIALKRDYIRYNDGSRYFDDLDQQPDLLVTAKALLLIGNEISNLNPSQHENTK